MTAAHVAFTERDLAVFDTRIAIVKQAIEFEQKTFGHAYPNGGSLRVRYLVDDLRVLEKQRAVIRLSIQQSK